MRLVGSESFRAVSLHRHAHIRDTRRGSSEEAEHAAARVSVQVACIVKVKRGSLSSVLIWFFFSFWRGIAHGYSDDSLKRACSGKLDWREVSMCPSFWMLTAVSLGSDVSVTRRMKFKGQFGVLLQQHLEVKGVKMNWILFHQQTRLRHDAIPASVKVLRRSCGGSPATLGVFHTGRNLGALQEKWLSHRGSGVVGGHEWERKTEAVLRLCKWGSVNISLPTEPPDSTALWKMHASCVQCGSCRLLIFFCFPRILFIYLLLVKSGHQRWTNQ